MKPHPKNPGLARDLHILGIIKGCLTFGDGMGMHNNDNGPNQRFLWPLHLGNLGMGHLERHHPKSDNTNVTKFDNITACMPC